MITDARVLQEDFVPRDVVHRHEEIDRLSAALDPLLDGDPAETPLLLGPTGVGKTCIARYTLEELRERLLDLRTAYVDCWSNHTRFRVLYELLDAVGRTVDVHRQSTPRDELLARLRERSEAPLVAVLDEVDQLAEPNLLYELLAVPHLHLVLVANREEALFADLDERVGSRLRGGPRIRFDRYTLDELTAILRARVEQGFEPGAVPEGVLREIADAAAGDARVGLSILRSAARSAERAGETDLTHDLVAEAVPDAHASIRQRTVDALTAHQRALYEVVADRGEVDPGTLYDAYRERVDEPKSKRTVRKYLAKMDRYNLVRAVGEKRGRTYQAVEGAP